MNNQGQIGTLPLTVSILVVSIVTLVFGLVFLQAFMDTDIISVKSNGNDTILSDDGIANTLSETPSAGFTATHHNQTWLDFDGVNDYVNNTFVFCPTEPFSFGAWAKGAGNVTGQYVIAVGNSSVANNFIGVTGLSTNANLSLNFQNGSGGGGIINGYVSVTNKSWHFYVVNSNGSQVRLYTDGVYTGAYTANVNTGYSCFNRMTIGALGRTTYSNYYNGSIDEYFFLNNSLSQIDITAMYKQSKHSLDIGQQVAIIYYHGVGGSSPSISVVNFTSQMNLINKSGFHTITATQLSNWMDGTGTLPTNPIMISFDDGYQSTYINATPIMTTYGFVGVMGLITNLTPSGVATAYLNWSEANDLVSKGWEINSHSYAHTNFTDINSSQRAFYFSQSKADILNNLSVTPIYFVYPYNGHNSSIDTECSQYYEICSGDVNYNDYVYQSSSKTANQTFRMGYGDDISNATILNMLFVQYNQKIKLNLDENQNGIAYDVSGNSNNGTITGATWNNDAVNVALLSTDYSLTGNQFTISNDDYSWDELLLSYAFGSENGDASVFGATNKSLIGLGTFGDFIPIIVLAIIASIVIGLIFIGLGRRISGR